MYFKNKKTGIVWHVTDKAHQKRLQADTGYLVVTNSKGQENDLNAHKAHKKNSKTEKVDFKNMDWQELRQYATEKGINTHGKKRKQIERELKEVGGVNDK